MGVVMKRARYFTTCNELLAYTVHETGAEYIRKALTAPQKKKKQDDRQMIIQFE
jgi:predicted DNA-binding helix-hairpin-helix protein